MTSCEPRAVERVPHTRRWSVALKPLVIAMFVLVGLAATPKAASAASYNCELTATGIYSYGPWAQDYTESSDPNAVGYCQNQVNILAALLCSGQPDGGPFYIRYRVRRWAPSPPFSFLIADETVPWQCIGGGAAYWP